VGIIGAGRAGSLFARALRLAGDEVVVGRAREIVEAAPELVLLAVPDRAIDGVVAELRALGFEAAGRDVVLLSGSASVEQLAPLADRGTRLMRVHPLLAIQPDASPDQLSGVTAAVTGRDAASANAGDAFARRLGMVPFQLADEARGAWHAAAAIASNLPVALLAAARDLAVDAGLDEASALRVMGDLALQSIEAARDDGPEQALTGPASRGDVGTIEAHVEAIARVEPEALPIYEAGTRAVVAFARAAGRLDQEQATRVLDAARGTVPT
jgi:predicted short-subunit dehydrogenase-like oxidoreductase (DUF2520 family)